MHTHHCLGWLQLLCKCTPNSVGECVSGNRGVFHWLYINTLWPNYTMVLALIWWALKSISMSYSDMPKIITGETNFLQIRALWVVFRLPMFTGKFTNEEIWSVLQKAVFTFTVSMGSLLNLPFTTTFSLTNVTHEPVSNRISQ